MKMKHKNYLSVLLTTALFFNLSTLNAASPIPTVHFPIKIHSLGNIYMVFDNPKLLGVCIAIKSRQVELGQNDESYRDLTADFISNYFPLHKKILNHILKYRSTCGSDDACYKKYIDPSDAYYLTAFVKATKSLNNTPLSELGIMEMAYCGKAVSN